MFAGNSGIGYPLLVIALGSIVINIWNQTYWPFLFPLVAILSYYLAEKTLLKITTKSNWFWPYYLLMQFCIFAYLSISYFGLDQLVKTKVNS